MIFKNINLKYRKQEVLQLFDLTLSLGEIVALIGKNGCGKTSFIKVVSDIIFFEGQILMNDKLITKKDYLYKREIGVFYQEQGFYSEDITLKNHFDLLLSLYKLKKKDTQLVEYCNLFDLPLNSSSLIRTFSSGMKQKAMFISSIIHNPTYLFLDEPFSNMDDFALDTCKKILTNMRKNQKSILLISHNSNIIQSLCDRIVLLNKGTNSFEANVKDIDIFLLKNDFNDSYLEFMLNANKK